MKTCLSLKPILLADYIDGQIDKDTKRSVEEHLASCPECRQLVALAREDMSVISDDGAKKKVPPHLWQVITGKIEQESAPTSAPVDFFQRLVERFTSRRFAPVLAGIILLVLSVSFFLYTQHIGRLSGDESFQYVSELFTNVGPQGVAGSDGLGTPIEEYFL